MLRVYCFNLQLIFVFQGVKLSLRILPIDAQLILPPPVEANDEILLLF